MDGASASTTVAGSTPVLTSDCSVNVGTAARRPVTAPDQGLLLIISKRRKLTERHGPSVRKRDLDGPQCIKRNSLLVGRARNDIDQINVVANLCDGAARDDRIKHARERL